MCDSATGSPADFFLGDEVEGRSPEAIRTPSDAVSEHLLELGFRELEAAATMTFPECAP